MNRTDVTHPTFQGRRTGRDADVASKLPEVVSPEEAAWKVAALTRYPILPPDMSSPPFEVCRTDRSAYVAFKPPIVMSA